jgi:dimeric dUTPase (all-alpha-NTP-PPase superfamily)
MTDRLQEMFDHQLEFQRRLYPNYPPSAGSPELMSSITETAYALSDEIHEATNETGWKPWASSNHVNRERYLGELVDAWHFFMNMCLLLEITPAELYEGYMQKIRINHERQNNGYTGVKEKCPGCNRAYDDPGTKCYPSDPIVVQNPAWCVDKGLIDVNGNRL